MPLWQARFITQISDTVAHEVMHAADQFGLRPGYGSQSDPCNPTGAPETIGSALAHRADSPDLALER